MLQGKQDMIGLELIGKYIFFKIKNKTKREDVIEVHSFKTLGKSGS